MKDSRDSHAHFPVRDYSLAVQSAVSWLGDRYLLATPVHALGGTGSGSNCPRTDQALMKLSRSGLTTSACVVHMPCGRPG